MEGCNIMRSFTSGQRMFNIGKRDVAARRRMHKIQLERQCWPEASWTLQQCVCHSAAWMGICACVVHLWSPDVHWPIGQPIPETLPAIPMNYVGMLCSWLFWNLINEVLYCNCCDSLCPKRLLGL